MQLLVQLWVAGPHRLRGMTVLRYAVLGDVLAWHVTTHVNASYVACQHLPVVFALHIALNHIHLCTIHNSNHSAHTIMARMSHYDDGNNTLTMTHVVPPAPSAIVSLCSAVSRACSLHPTGSILCITRCWAAST